MLLLDARSTPSSSDTCLQFELPNFKSSTVLFVPELSSTETNTWEALCVYPAPAGGVCRRSDTTRRSDAPRRQRLTKHRGSFQWAIALTKSTWETVSVNRKERLRALVATCKLQLPQASITPRPNYPLTPLHDLEIHASLPTPLRSTPSATYPSVTQQNGTSSLHSGHPSSCCTLAAYALQDNELWLRHLQTLVVQVLGAAYVLYNHVAGDSFLILLAAILMFSVGVVKYAERTWALRCGNLDRIRSTLRDPLAKHYKLHTLDEQAGDEFYVRRAHSLFHVCKHAIVDSWIQKDPEDQTIGMLNKLKKEKEYRAMWTLMEMELSLMYDLLYTKAGIIHTWLGYCIRVISPPAITASLLLFHFSGKDGHRRLDITVSYTLLVGALILETGSLLRTLGSTWTYAFLCATPWSWLRYAALCTGRWDRFRRFVKTITGRGGRNISERRWSGKMGQYNLLHSCSRHDRTYIPLLGRFVRMLGYKEWWVTYYYSRTIHIPDYLKEKLFKYIDALNGDPKKRERSLNAQGLIRKNWGQEALQDLYKDFKKDNLLGVEFQECIIIWHIGTDVFLAKSSESDVDDAGNLVNAIRMLSNYMFFLLVDRHYMLPGLPQSTLYRRTRGNLAKLWDENDRSHPEENMYTRLKELFSRHDEANFTGWNSRDKLAIILYEQQPGYKDGVPRLWYANEVTKKLRDTEKNKGSLAVLELLLNVWMDFLVYAANRCSRESHAKKLSNGGELTTILWLMTNYLHQGDYALKPEGAEVKSGYYD
ncbi:hypothetical protein PR202_gb27449 [Eleusine coracana subsp. coracana]|uniref:DUF4220 domain-containing protein n=1 Tax=Eleusine coracana subsp. coracana TaxID=191504 RepID=A0AAV5FUS4_ELECO|nr:hypothetical protein PR202_gb27449 [Eleusine coracana subsp. coracana]